MQISGRSGCRWVTIMKIFDKIKCYYSLTFLLILSYPAGAFINTNSCKSSFKFLGCRLCVQSCTFRIFSWFFYLEKYGEGNPSRTLLGCWLWFQDQINEASMNSKNKGAFTEALPKKIVNICKAWGGPLRISWRRLLHSEAIHKVRGKQEMKGHLISQVE